MTATLRPNQISQYEDTKLSLTEKLANKNVHDKKAVRSQLTRIEKEFEAQRPKEVPSSEVDAAVKECSDLQEEILRGMPSQEEMRKSPPGAIGKHRDWEKANKVRIQRWKELKLRLNIGSDDPDIANLEMFRPKASSLNMDNAHIPGKDIFIPDSVSVCKPFSDEDINLLRERVQEDVFNRLATMTGEQRTILRQQFLTTWVAEPVEGDLSLDKPQLGDIWSSNAAEEN